MDDAIIASAAVETNDQDAGKKPSENKAEDIFKLKTKIDDWLIRLLAAGAVSAVLYGAAAGVRQGFRSIDPYQLLSSLVGVLLALALAGAALGLGTLSGFLFGLPRALTNPEVRQLGNLGVAATRAPDDTAKAGGATAEMPHSQFQVGRFAINTNLERISDWLTTMIVGIGLANLTSMTPAIEAFGDRFDGIFGFGGKVFAIGCGLYFLIFGFLLSYISTRTKLTLIFTENEYDATVMAGGGYSKRTAEAISRSASAGNVIASNAPPSPSQVAEAKATAADPATPLMVQQLESDKKVIDEIGTAQNASNRQEILALANARARSGDADGAVSLYQEVIRSSAFDAKIWLDYASTLGLANREATFSDLLVEIRSKGTTGNEAEARQNFASGLLGALQAHLYDGRYEESIKAGETLQRYTVPVASDSWRHIWLACAYGQRHAQTNDKATRKEARDAVLTEVKEAIRIDPAARDLLRSLYQPAVNAKDRDLESLHPDEELDKLLAAPATTEPVG